MADLPDWEIISNISIPGTHETMSSVNGGRPVYCQSVQDLRLQLDAGIRALDIRCYHIENRFAINHNVYYQNAYLGEPLPQDAGHQNVLKKCVQFLYDHPTEFILMRIQPTNGETDCTRSFSETFQWYIEEDGCSILSQSGDSTIHYRDLSGLYLIT